MRFETVEAPFEPGDVFVFYTDGITEAAAAAGVDFGRAARRGGAWPEARSAAAVVAAVHAAADAFRGRRPARRRRDGDRGARPGRARRRLIPVLTISLFTIYSEPRFPRDRPDLSRRPARLGPAKFREGNRPMTKHSFLAAAAIAALVLPATLRADHHASKDIVDTAVAAGDFKTLAAALQAAGLVETLKGKGPFTVFAPTDEAFAKLPGPTSRRCSSREQGEAHRDPHLPRGRRQGDGGRRREARPRPRPSRASR